MMPYKPSLLKIVDLFKTFTQGTETLTVLDSVTYTFTQGYSYSLTGASGSGKSTLLHILAGIESPTAGAVYFNTQDISLLSPTQRAVFLQTGVSLIFQEPTLINELSVLENTMIKGLIRGEKYAHASQKGLALLEKVGLAHKSTTFPATLSGGEQQRVALARALFSEPAFILADEPTAHLDKETKEHILELLLLYQHTQSIGLIIASHDDEVIRAVQTTLTLTKGVLTKGITTHGN